MKIAIIGAGWFGCHLAKSLINDAQVQIFEKSEIFSGASSKNQNRLHLGFHYPRCSKTRAQARLGFEKFIGTYGFCVEDVPSNLYGIHNESFIDFNSYKAIFAYENYSFRERDVNYQFLEGVVECDEKRILPDVAKKYFQSTLAHKLVVRDFKESDVRCFDYVIDCSNGAFRNIAEDYYYEGFLHLDCKVEKPLPNLIIMDGPFFSIYPSGRNRVTITHVSKGITARANSLKELHSAESKIDFEKRVDDLFASVSDTLSVDVREMVSDVRRCRTVKIKSRLPCDSRVATVKVWADNVLTVIPGKIDAIFDIEDQIKKKIYG